MENNKEFKQIESSAKKEIKGYENMITVIWSCMLTLIVVLVLNNTKKVESGEAELNIALISFIGLSILSLIAGYFYKKRENKDLRKLRERERNAVYYFCDFNTQDCVRVEGKDTAEQIVKSMDICKHKKTFDEFKKEAVNIEWKYNRL